MIAASVLVWVNLQERGFDENTGGGVWMGGITRGWPVTWVVEWRSMYRPSEPNGILWQGLMADIAIVVLILGMVGGLFEIWARRR